jgi:cytidylate kinase
VSTYDGLIPSIDKRLETWANLQNKANKKSLVEKKYSITLSREFGCEGYPLATELKKKLEHEKGGEWTVFDKALIERVSKDKNLSENFLENLGDDSQVMEILSIFKNRQKTQSEAFEILSEYIVKLAKAGNAILVGRGSTVLTNNLDNCFHFRLVAPFEYRVESISRRLDLSYEDAKKMVKEEEKRRDKFIEKHLSCNINDPLYYHAIFNNERNSITHISESIYSLMESFLGN